jgi:hypothetical protein
MGKGALQKDLGTGKMAKRPIEIENECSVSEWDAIDL